MAREKFAVQLSEEDRNQLDLPEGVLVELNIQTLDAPGRMRRRTAPIRKKTPGRCGACGTSTDARYHAQFNRDPRRLRNSSISHSMEQTILESKAASSLAATDGVRPSGFQGC